MDFNPKSLAEMTPRQIARYWPNLAANYHKTSEQTIDYNCVAWIVNQTDNPIDFSVDEEGDPLPDADLTSAPYKAYFESIGFTECENGDLEEGFQKIAIYEFPDGQFAHVAKQLENGHWSSKIGELEDIEHYSLNALEYENYNGECYGVVKFFMKRPPA
ncbi:MAG: hypothetical protein QM737_10990 [Ferruginibacter sp.]